MGDQSRYLQALYGIVEPRLSPTLYYFPAVKAHSEIFLCCKLRIANNYYRFRYLLCAVMKLLNFNERGRGSEIFLQKELSSVRITAIVNLRFGKS